MRLGDEPDDVAALLEHERDRLALVRANPMRRFHALRKPPGACRLAARGVVTAQQENCGPQPPSAVVKNLKGNKKRDLIIRAN